MWKTRNNPLSKQRYHYFLGKCDWCGHSAAEVAYLYDSTKLGLLFVWRKPATIAEVNMAFNDLLVHRSDGDDYSLGERLSLA